MEKSVRVLIVDDEEDFIEPIAFWLQSKGYGVMKATSGSQALDLIKDNPPDIVFLDMYMPEMDGAETLRRIREVSKDLPVIIVTAVYQDEATFAKVKPLGISGFFPKKSSLEELGQILQVTLRTHSKIKRSGK